MVRRRGKIEESESDLDKEEIDDNSSLLSSPINKKDNKRKKSKLIENSLEEQEESFEDDNLLPGTILKIKLKDFLTYDKVEVYPGPHLNMVIGPNGTGKSSIVCAIALGLAANTNSLGRAKELTDFIRHGKKEAIIEITLKGHSNSNNNNNSNNKNKNKNIIIQRNFSIKDSKNQSKNIWKINGEISKKEQVLKVIEDLNIQINNLCQFLPQDRVSEFARLQSTDLLKETQRAIDETLLIKHQELINLQNSTNNLSNVIENDKQKITTLQTKINELERELSRLKQRTQILHTIKLLKFRIPWAKYTLIREEYLKMKDDLQNLTIAIKEIEKSLEPLKKQKEIHEKNLSLKDKDKEKYIKLIKKEKDSQSKLVERIEKCEQDQFGIRDSIGNLGKEYEKKRIELRNLQTEKDNIEKELDQFLENLESNGLYDRKTQKVKSFNDIIKIPGTPLYEIAKTIEKKEKEWAEWNTKLNQKNLELEDISKESQIFRNKRENVLTQINALSDISKQKLHILEKYHPDVYKAFRWINDNKSQFRDIVYNPVFLEINTTNPNLAYVVENVLGGNIIMTFFCKNKQDYDLLGKELLDKKKWRINIQYLPLIDLSKFNYPIPINTIKKIGMQGYVKDLINASPEILSYLCQTSKIHMIPYSQNHDIDFDKADELLKTYIAGDTRFAIKEAYGVSSRRSNKIALPKLLSLNIDTEYKQRLENDLKEIYDELKKLEEFRNKISNEH